MIGRKKRQDNRIARIHRTRKTRLRMVLERPG